MVSLFYCATAASSVEESSISPLHDMHVYIISERHKYFKRALILANFSKFANNNSTR